MLPRHSIHSVVSSARSRSRSTPPATSRCSHGSRTSASWERSVSKEPVLMGPGWRGFFDRHGVDVIEVDRPNRAEARAARASPIRSMQSKPPEQRSVVEQRASRSQKTARSRRSGSSSSPSARHARRGSKALTQMRHLVITAPDELRRRMKGLSVAALVKEGAKLRPRSADPVTAGTKAAHLFACASDPNARA